MRAFGALRSASIPIIATVQVVEVAKRSCHARGTSVADALLDRTGTEVLACHWPPGPTCTGPDHPHVHVSAPDRFPDAQGNAVLVDLDNLHLATGPVPSPPSSAR